MKKSIFCATTLVTLGMFAQPALLPPAPAISPATPAASTFAPALSPTPPANLIPTQPVTNLVTVSLTDLAPLLTNLEANIVQTLPVLSDFNDEFDFVSIVPGAPQPLNGPGFAFAPSISGGTSATTVGAPVVTQMTLTPSSGFILPPGLEGPGTTNGARTITLTRDTLRALVVLQIDMERMLPVLDAINGGTNFINLSVTNGTLR